MHIHHCILKNCSTNIRNQTLMLLPFLLFLFLVLIPVEFYIMGQGFGFGIKGICYQYQVTYLGNSFMPITYENQYVLSGIITGKNAYAIFVWTLGAIIFGIATGSLFFSAACQSRVFQMISAGGVIVASILFILSDMLKYGLFFSGPAGLALPFALPLLLFLGWVIYRVPTPQKT